MFWNITSGILYHRLTAWISRCDRKKERKTFEKERHLIRQSEKRKICMLSRLFFRSSNIPKDGKKGN